MGGDSLAPLVWVLVTAQGQRLQRLKCPYFYYWWNGCAPEDLGIATELVGAPTQAMVVAYCSLHTHAGVLSSNNLV